MAVARLLIGELLMEKRQHGAVAGRLEPDGHLRFAFRRALESPAEDQLAVGHDLAIDAADAVVLAVRSPELHAKAAAHAHVGLGDRWARTRSAAPPFDHLLGLRPRFVDRFRRGFE